MSKPKKVDPNNIVVSTPALPLNTANAVGLSSDNPFTTRYTNAWDNFKNFASGSYDAVDKILSGVGYATAAYGTGKALYTAYKAMTNPRSMGMLLRAAGTFRQPLENVRGWAPQTSPSLFSKYLNKLSNWASNNLRYKPGAHHKLPTEDLSHVFGSTKPASNSFTKAWNDVWMEGARAYPINTKGAISGPPSWMSSNPVLNPNWIPKGMSLTSTGYVPQPQNFSTFYAKRKNPRGLGPVPSLKPKAPQFDPTNNFGYSGSFLHQSPKQNPIPSWTNAVHQ